MGRDIFSDSEPLVIFLNRSFITDKGQYNAVREEFHPTASEQVDEDYIDNLLETINKKFHYSAKILDTNYYSKLGL